MSDLQNQMIAVQEAIYKNDYYIRLYEQVINGLNLTKENIQNSTISDNKIVELCNIFWYALPDSNAIRREPFYQLCDIAEQIFNIEDSD